jgi:prophage tail gpP-like protein
MIKSLAALGVTAALVFTPVVAFAQDATPTPAMSDAKPMKAKPMKHKMKAKHVMKKSMKKMKAEPTPAATDAPK